MPTATSRGTNLHYTISGQGEPIVLLHSFLCSGEMWRGQVGVLAESHQVINLDLRGHGRSGPATNSLTLEYLADDVIAVLDHEEIETAAWAGLSIGGMISLRAALDHPGRVSSLQLFDTDAGPEQPIKRLEYRMMALVARTLGLRPLLGSVSKMMFGQTSFRSRRALVNEWRERFSQVHLPSVLRILEALVRRRDLLPRLPSIDVPTLVAVGTEDRSLPPERSRKIAANIPNCRYLEIPAAGHLSVLEQPEIASQVLSDALAPLKQAP